MTDSLSQTIQRHVASYLGGQSTLADLEDWLVPETWDLAEDDDAAAYDLASEIIFRISEFTSGDWTEPELRDLLSALSEFQEKSVVRREGLLQALTVAIDRQQQLLPKDEAAQLAALMQYVVLKGKASETAQPNDPETPRQWSGENETPSRREAELVAG
jgi:hypothetical protein